MVGSLFPAQIHYSRSSRRGDPRSEQHQTSLSRCRPLLHIAFQFKWMMKAFSRPCRRAYNLFNASAGQARRTFVTQAQRRKATTSAGGGLGFPIVDHHYECVYQTFITIWELEKLADHGTVQLWLELEGRDWEPLSVWRRVDWRLLASANWYDI